MSDLLTEEDGKRVVDFLKGLGFGEAAAAPTDTILEVVQVVLLTDIRFALFELLQYKRNEVHS